MAETMADEWDHFERVDIAPTAPHIQRVEMRKAFYAGLASGVKLALSRTPEENLAEMNEHIAAEDSRRRLVRIRQLMEGDPAPNSPLGKELLRLVDEQEAYEKPIFEAMGFTRDTAVAQPKP